jgi:hypothetical protein
MSRIMGKPYGIPAFARHLNAFTDEARSAVLHKRGEQRRYFYRFENPLLQPFVILTGLSNGLISEDLLRKLQEKEHAASADGFTLDAESLL